MIEDAKVVLDRCAQIKNEPKRGRKAINLLRKWRRDELQDEIKQERVNIEKARVFRAGLDTGLTNRRIMDIERLLEEQSPLPITPAVKDAVSKRERELRAEIVEGMPDRETYRRNPPGAEFSHRTWHNANKSKILEWKNLRIQLEPESDDRDLANIELYRPALAPGLSTSTFMPQAQIPGHHAMTPLAKENWPEGMGEPNSALVQARDREVGNGEADHQTRTDVVKPPPRKRASYKPRRKNRKGLDKLHKPPIEQKEAKDLVGQSVSSP